MIRSAKVKPAQVAGDPPRSITDLQEWNSCCTQRARLCRKYLESVRNGKYSRWIFTVEVRDEPCSLCRTCKLHPHSIWTGGPGPGAPDRSVLAYLHYIQVIRVFLQDRVVVVCHANTLRSGHGFSTYYFPRRTLTFGFLSDSPCGTPVLYSSSPSPSPSLLETLPTALFAPSLFWLSRLQTCAVSCHA